jgi:hypothetical protein
MSDNDPVRHRADQVAAQGKAFQGEAWDKFVARGLAYRMGKGEVSQGELIEDLGRNDAVNRIFGKSADGMLEQASMRRGDADYDPAAQQAADAEYTAWRDSQRKKKR